MQYVKFWFPKLSLLMVALVLVGLYTEALARHDYKQVRWENLDLSREQREHLNTLDAQWHSSVMEMKPKIESKQKRLKTLMSAPKADDSEILRVQQELHEEKARLKREATQIFLNKKKVLNQQQQQKLQHMLEH